MTDTDSWPAPAALETQPPRGPQSPLHSAVRSVLGSSLFLGLVLAIFSWPYNAKALVPVPGIDGGWSASLEMAVVHRLPFGTHVLFTYGPLGFLSVWNLYFPPTAAASFVFLLALYTLVSAALVWSLRRVVPLLLAILVAFVAGTLSIGTVALLYTGEPEKSLALALVGCVYVLSRPVDEPAPPYLWVVFGISLSIFALVKVSTGTGIAVALTITIICLPKGRLRALGLVAVSALASFAVAWFATGNGLGNMVAFAKGAAAVISGYSAAMSIEVPTVGYTYGCALGVVILVGGLAVARTWNLPRRAQVGIGLVTLFLVWQFFEEGFVRHDQYHVRFSSRPHRCSWWPSCRRFAAGRGAPRPCVRLWPCRSWPEWWARSRPS